MRVNAPYLTLNIADSSGGINTRFHETEIQDNQVTVGYNMDISTPGKKKKRLGANTVLNDLGSTPILGLTYLKAPSVDPRMCFIHGKRMYKSTLPLETAGSWVDIDSTDHFTNNTLTTVSILAGDELFFSNGTDNVFSYDGTSITDEGATTSDPPKGKCMAYFKNRLWVANTTSNPDWIYYSDSLDPHAFNHSTQVFKVSTGDSTEVTNMISYAESALVIFKERSIHELLVSGGNASYWNLRPIDSRYGCIAPECAKFHNGKIYFLSHDGIRVLPLQQNAISYLIKDEIDDINWEYINRARAIIFDDKYFIAVPTGSSTYPDKVYVIDTNTNGWVVYTGWNVGCWGIWIEDNAEVLMYGDSNDGYVWHCFKSTQFNDGATAINYQEETKAFDMGKPFRYKCGGEIEVEIASSTGNTVTVSAAIDGGSYTQLGTCTATTVFGLDSLGPWKNIKFKFQNNATSTEQLIFNGFRGVTFLEEYLSEVTA
jgi:hypothetical protein